MTKLGHYLKEREISQVAFAQRLARRLGRAVVLSQSFVSRWASGARIPNVVYWQAIEEETGGEVPASYWLTLSKRRAHKPRSP